jgi:nucleoside-diphosphate-sugar epimerase
MAGRGQKILVTGAGGFVGAAVVGEALTQGFDVVALVRSPAPHRLAGLVVDIRACDLSKSDGIAAILDETRPNVVIHSAWEGVGGPNRASDVQFDNIRTSVALADAAIVAGVEKFVGIGSQAEYGRYDRRITEDDLPNPSILYGAAKLAAMHLIRQRMETAGREFAWMRLFSTYGPGDNANWLIPSVLTQLSSGISPKLTAGTQTWDYLHISDVARGILAAANTKGATGVFNLASGVSTPVRAIVEYLRNLVCPKLDLRFGEVPFATNQIMHLEGDISRLTSKTGWQPNIDIWDGLNALAQPAADAA